MDIKNLISKGKIILKEAGLEDSSTEANLLLCYILNKDKVFIYTNPDFKIDEIIEQKFLALIKKRASHFPLQYILGHQEFMSLDFIVTPNVLIPRSDTEILVEHIIEISKNKFPMQQLKILDVGTGSGCISISLAHYIKYVQITTVDISEDAINIAKTNAKNHMIFEKISFVKSDLFKELADEKFDIIVSNPPYIPSSDILLLQSEVREFEPITALDGGMDGLDFYKQIISTSINFLNKNGILAFEFGIGQENAIKLLMEKYFYDIKIIKDFSNINRVISGVLY